MKTRFFWTAAVLPRWFLRIPTSVHPLPSTAPQRETPRSVSNAIFLLSNLNPTGTAGSLYVTPKSLTLLPGHPPSAWPPPWTPAGTPMDTLPGDVTWSSADNAVSASGLFTAPAAPGVYQVSAEAGE